MTAVLIPTGAALSSAINTTVGSSNTSASSSIINTSAPGTNSSSNMQPTSPVIPRSSTPEPTAAMIISAYSLLSPSSKKAVELFLKSTIPADSTLPPVTSPNSTDIIMSSARETIPNTDRKYNTPPAILHMVRNLCHVPLTLFTSTATKKLHTQDSMLKKVTIYHRTDGSERMILDLTEFPDEADMDIHEWHDAWHRFAAFIENHGDESVKRRWKKHFEFLIGQDEFENNFQVILRFDIEERTRYLTSRHSVDPTHYPRRFAQLQLQMIREELKLLKEQAIAAPFKASATPEKSYGPPRRFTPYMREKHHLPLAPMTPFPNPFDPYPSTSSASENTRSPAATRRRRRKANKRLRTTNGQE